MNVIANKKSMVPEGWRAFADASTWVGFPWPEWIPEKVCLEIMDFWDPQYRGPKEYLRFLDDPYGAGTISLGTWIAARELGEGPACVGRWVPMWNNISRLIGADGTVYYASTCYARPARFGWGGRPE